MNELVAIIKYERKDEEGNLKGNMIELADTHVLISKLGDNIPRDQKYAIQRFVKFKGVKPFICRMHWKREKDSRVYIVTNTKNYEEEKKEELKYVTN